MDPISSGLILLTYKNKVLLMHKQKNAIDAEKHPWSLISGVKKKKESFEEVLSKRVETETGMKIKDIEFVSEFYYHARLTDDNVNNIQREENQLLDFFTIKELKKLLLTNSTHAFVSKYEGLIINPIVD